MIQRSVVAYGCTSAASMECTVLLRILLALSTTAKYGSMMYILYSTVKRKMKNGGRVFLECIKNEFDPAF